ncbi:uncharacterized protein LOC117316464 isoform X2 [Pecten maximus]|uniref:uncharacterized protein LOC117316464 isoform X2 n=1 Tax=Pecten maximus TaxID=6579 RepID=UPI0014585DCB|nr:uncharacterized protein LOC117316464 isoform X2 [Pecten maximus]
MAKVEAGSESKRITISQLPLYSNPEPKKYEDVSSTGTLRTTLKGYVSPVTRALLPGLTYVKAGTERAKEIGQTGYAHTMTSVQVIQNDPYGPASVGGGAVCGILLGIRGGKIMKSLLSVSGAALGGYMYYYQPWNQASEIFSNLQSIT